VTRLAFHQGVRPHQRKTVLVIANRIQRNVPALDGVAAFAVGPELAAMYIRVAIGAVCTHILEYQARVTLCARYLLVHAAQRITSLVVTELGIRPDWLPTRVSMAILARSSDWTMGIRHLGLRTAHLWTSVVRWLLRRHAEKQGR
jgi:hypothetical protein